MKATRAYRIALAVSLACNALLVAALYFYTSVEDFLSMISMAVGMFN